MSLRLVHSLKVLKVNTKKRSGIRKLIAAKDAALDSPLLLP